MKNADLAQLAVGLTSGEWEANDLISHLEIQFQDWEPLIAAFLPEIGRFGRLREEIQILYDQYREADSRPPLFGIPVGVKDIFHVQGFETFAGSDIPPSSLAGEEARSVSQLKAAGALIFGKTVTTEFAYFAPGPTRNPRKTDHTPGGSSSGSAAAVGAGMIPLALGTQTIGSIIRPAAFCGVVGFKPSYDRISRAGVIPLSPSLDHIGFFTADIAGANLAASVLVSGWKSPATPRLPVLGIPAGPYLEMASSEAMENFHNCVERLSRGGYSVRQVSVMDDFVQVAERHNQLLAAESAIVHREWFDEFEERYHPRTADLIRRGLEMDSERVAKVRAGREQLRGELDSAMKEHDIDLWISPSALGAAPKGLESTGDPVMNLPWTQSGLPTVSVPSGVNEAGLPLGLQIVAGWFEDEALLSWGNDIEALLKSNE
jgi:Asp-tRNA(Asn)/Glu-tRNA(Gln) amidotransferase A subunit family amidase